MSRRGRLSAIHGRLSASDQVLVWVQEVREHPSLEAYVRMNLGKRPPLAAIVARMTPSNAEARRSHVGKNVISGRAIRQPVADERSQHWFRAERRSARDAAFLFALILEVNRAACDTATRVALGASLGLLSHARFYGDSPVPPSGDAEVDRRDAKVHDAFWPNWVTAARATLDAMHLWTATRATIEADYFDGADVRFPESAELEQVAASLLEELAEDVEAGEPRDPNRGRRRRRAGQQGTRPEDQSALVPAAVARLCDLARIEAHRQVGEDTKALAIVERLLGPTNEDPTATPHAE